MIKRTSKLEIRLKNLLRRCKNKRHESGEQLYLQDSRPYFGERAAEIVKRFDRWIEPSRRNKLWIGISGSWRVFNQQVVDDAAYITRYFVNRGIGIVNGLAPGVDFISNEVLLKEGEDPYRAHNLLRGIAPMNRDAYMQRFSDAHLQQYEDHEEVINRSQADAIGSQLHYINFHFPEIIFDETHFNEKEFLTAENDHYRELAYNFRNGLVDYAVDGLVALCVNESKGVKDAVEKLKKMEKPFLVLTYDIQKKSREVISDYSQLNIPNLPKEYPLPLHARPPLSEESTNSLQNPLRDN